MSMSETFARLRALGVPDSAIPGVIEWAEEKEAEARRPRTSTERSQAYRERKRNEDATKTLQERPADVAEPLQNRPEIVAEALPLVRAYSTGEEVSISLEASASKGADAPPLPQIIASAEKPLTPDAALYRRAKSIFGASCGGQIAKLKALCGGDIAETRQIVEQAALAENPSEYLAAVINRSGPRANMSRAGPASPYGTRNGKRSVSDFTRAQDERVNGTVGDDRGGSFGEVRQIPRW